MESSLRWGQAASHENAEATIKIIDFGTSAFCKTTLSQRSGTALYIAPEVLSQEYNEKCDVWSCGVILFILLSGKPPFYGRTDREVLRRIQKGEYSMKGPEWSQVSVGAKRLVTKMLEYNHKTRISASEAVQDEWIISYGSCPASSREVEASVLENLKNFHADQKLQHAVLTFIASQLVT